MGHAAMKTCDSLCDVFPAHIWTWHVVMCDHDAGVQGSSTVIIPV